MSLPSLRLKANAERRLRAGHLWVYSNEVDVAATPLSLFAAGDLVDRGPYSPRVLEWLEHPWFASVRGNHEQLVKSDRSHVVL